jgi:hypothetical protein
MSGARVRKAGRGLLGNSIALLAMTHITSLLGYVFWMACARHVSAGAIGMTSTVISAARRFRQREAGLVAPRRFELTDEERALVAKMREEPLT